MRKFKRRKSKEYLFAFLLLLTVSCAHDIPIFQITDLYPCCSAVIEWHGCSFESNLYFKLACLSKIIIALFLLRQSIICDTLYFGRIERKKEYDWASYVLLLSQFLSICINPL